VEILNPGYSRIYQSAQVLHLGGTKGNSEALIDAQAQVPQAYRENGNLMYRIQNIVSVLAFLALLSGCGSNVTLKDPSIPQPLIDQLPMKVGARYPESFDHFVHEERIVGKEKWSIDLGASNRILFTNLFSAMFTEFQVVAADIDASELGLDAFIEPTIDAFEFSVPNQSKTDEFAVWIRYRIRIFDGEGNQVANWPISAYGKAQSTTFGGDASLRRAAVLALRDAAALVIMQMDKATGISKLNAARRQIAPPPAATEPKLPTAEILQTTAAEESPDDSG